MAQAGVHGLVGLLGARQTPGRKQLALGFVLGNVLPDADILVAGPAVLFGYSADQFHRTFTHSILTAAAVAIVLSLIGRLRKSSGWAPLGVGLSLGMVAHILVDLLLWFRGVRILWPSDLHPNIWRGMAKRPDWWEKTELSAEFLCFAAFFAVLILVARKRKSNSEGLPALRCWTILQLGLFVIFTLLALLPNLTVTSFKCYWWLPYVASLGLMFYVIVHMRDTITGLPKALGTGSPTTRNQ